MALHIANPTVVSKVDRLARDPLEWDAHGLPTRSS